MGDAIDRPQTAKKIVTRLQLWIDQLNSLVDAFPRSPKLAKMSKWSRAVILASYHGCIVVILLPLAMMVVLLEGFLLFFYTLDRFDHREKGQPPFFPSTFIKHAESGESLSRAGRKGAAAKARNSPNFERNELIRDDAQNLLDMGKDIRSLPGILARRYAGIGSYPTSDKQYRTIIQSLRNETRKNRKSSG